MREKLALFEGAVRFAVWWNTVLMNQGFKLPSRPMLINYASEVNDKAAFILDATDSSSSLPMWAVQDQEDWKTMVHTLKSEKLRLTDTLNAMMAEKESLAISLEGNHEDKIERIVRLEDRHVKFHDLFSKLIYFTVFFSCLELPNC